MVVVMQCPNLVKNNNSRLLSYFVYKYSTMVRNRMVSYLNFLARTWLQLPGAAHKSTTLLTPVTYKWQCITHNAQILIYGNG